MHMAVGFFIFACYFSFNYLQLELLSNLTDRANMALLFLARGN